MKGRALLRGATILAWALLAFVATFILVLIVPFDAIGEQQLSKWTSSEKVALLGPCAALGLVGAVLAARKVARLLRAEPQAQVMMAVLGFALGAAVIGYVALELSIMPNFGLF